eukprot:COSAG01_NODE_5786_length_4034_cov_2.996442_2_plen_65_part_00
MLQSARVVWEGSIWNVLREEEIRVALLALVADLQRAPREWLTRAVSTLTTPIEWQARLRAHSQI